jgi:hypothetical protein
LDKTARKKKAVYHGSVLLLSPLVHESNDFLSDQDHKDYSNLGACLSQSYDLHSRRIYCYQTPNCAVYSQNRVGNSDLPGNFHHWVRRIYYYVRSKRIHRCLQAQRLVSNNGSVDPDLWVHLPGSEIDPRAGDLCDMQFHGWDSSGRPQLAWLSRRKLFRDNTRENFHRSKVRGSKYEPLLWRIPGAPTGMLYGLKRVLTIKGAGEIHG